MDTSGEEDPAQAQVLHEEEDDDLRCCVCGYDMSFDENDIVACSGCPVAVHQRCYGIKNTVRGDWFCQACTFDVPPTTLLECQLCNFRGISAMAVTSDRKWVHGHCSSWLLKMDPILSEKMDLSATPVTDMCDVCAPEKCQPCIVCKQPGKVLRCSEPGCRNHFHPWCMSRHSAEPMQLVYWGHYTLETDSETLLPYAYCYEHAASIPFDTQEAVRWHLPSKQVARSRRATEVSDEMRRMKAISKALEALEHPAAAAQGPTGDTLFAAALRLCNGALSQDGGLRFSRPLKPTMQVVAMIHKRLQKATRGRDQRVRVAEELAHAMVAVDFITASWLLQLLPAKEYPLAVERRARELAAHLHALRALCRVIMEKIRTGPDPLALGPRKPWSKVRRLSSSREDDEDEALMPRENGDEGEGMEGGDPRRKIRLIGIEGREALVGGETRCVVCLENTQLEGEDGNDWYPKRCVGCGMTAHMGCSWCSHSKSVCGICKDSNRLLTSVVLNDMYAVHSRLLDKIRASPFWLTPPPAAGDRPSPIQQMTTPLHEAARHGRYELLSMMLHHSRGRGMLPGACLAEDGKGQTAFDVATAAHETECARLLTTTFCDLPRPDPALGWREGRRSGKDIAGGREGVAIPWVNELDDEPFPSHSFTYITRVVEGYGASFNWRLCSDEGSDKVPIACRHMAPAESDDSSHGGGGGGGGGGGPGAGLGAPAGIGGGGGPGGKAGVSASLAFMGGSIGGARKGGCDIVKCGHVVRGHENGRAYECNYRCPCAERLKLTAEQVKMPGKKNPLQGEDGAGDCGLRASQARVRAPLEVFKTATKGWGVRATATIEQGTYICTYAGELIPEKTYQEREPEYEIRDRSAGESGGGGACYCFNVYEDKRNPENNLVVDADRYRGVAALFNHTCCNANVEVRKLVANNTDPRYPVHAFFARRRVEVKEGLPLPELVFNYGTRETPNPCLCDACEEVRRNKTEPPLRLR